MSEPPQRPWWVVAVVASLVGSAGAFAMLPTPDVTWLLHVTGRLLDNAQLGSDVVENTPPVILWLKLPAVQLARSTGWDSWLIWTAAVSLLAGSTVLASAALFRRVPSLKAHAPMLTAVVAVGLFLLPRQEFGQREHVAISLVLPWLLLVGARIEGAAFSGAAILPAGIAGGVGLAIKPHFGLVWLAVGAVLVAARGWRAAACRELMVPAAVAAGAVIGTLVLHPHWLEYARLYGPLYQHYRAANPLWVALAGEGVEWSWLGLLAWLAFRTGRGGWGALAVLLAAQVGFHLVAALQMKGWPYHMLPAGVLGLIVAAGAAARAEWPSRRLVERVYRVAVPVGISVAALFGGVRTARLLAQPEAKWAEADPSLRDLLAEVRRSGERETLLVLSTNIGSGWPLSHMAGADWTLRHPSLWMLGAVYADELKRPGMVRMHPEAEWTGEEQRMVREVAQDLESRPPTMVLIPQPTPGAPLWAIAGRVEYGAIATAPPMGAGAKCVRTNAREVGSYLVRHCAKASGE